MLQIPANVNHNPWGVRFTLKWSLHSACLVRDKDIHRGGCRRDHWVRTFPHRTFSDHGQHWGEYPWRTSEPVTLTSLLDTTSSAVHFREGESCGHRFISLWQGLARTGRMHACVCSGDSRLISEVPIELLGRRERTTGLYHEE